MTSNYSLPPMGTRDSVNYGIGRARDIAFDAVYKLWLRRQAEGMTQADLAKAIGRDEGWVSRTLSGPGNWTLRTIGTLVQGLNGEIEITVHAMEDPIPNQPDGDAYDRYLKRSAGAADATAGAGTTRGEVGRRR